MYVLPWPCSAALPTRPASESIMTCHPTQVCHLTPSFGLPEFHRRVTASGPSRPAGILPESLVDSGSRGDAPPGLPSGRGQASRRQPLLPRHRARDPVPTHPGALPDIQVSARGRSWFHQPARVCRPGRCWSPARSLRISRHRIPIRVAAVPH